MTTRTLDRFALAVMGRTARRRRHTAAGLLVAIAVVSLMLMVSEVAGAQFGALKRLKNSISPDSAAKVAALKQDSIALAAKVAAGDTTPLHRSRLSRAVSAASSASNKFEQATGVSATDVALAATGVGAGAVMAKKLGSPTGGLGGVGGPGGIGGALQQAATARAQSRAATAVAGAATPDLGALMRGAAGAGGLSPLGAAAGIGSRASGLTGLTAADAQAMAVFQQQMMQVAMAASAGDVSAQARLQRWQAIALTHQAEIERLSLAGGDVAAMQRLQAIQLQMFREWASTGPGLSTAIATPRAPKKRAQ